MTHSRNGKSKFANVTGIFLLFLIAESWISFSSGQGEMKVNLMGCFYAANMHNVMVARN